VIVVKVELHSAITGEVTEIGRMLIANTGGTKKRGDYTAKVLRLGLHFWRTHGHRATIRLGFRTQLKALQHCTRCPGYREADVSM
jgi:hypothetical protein